LQLESDPGTLQPGQVVGDGVYRIQRLLGKGGMGAVYLAANTRAFDRPCVVKEIIEYYDSSDPGARRKAIQRFEAEARTLAGLKHTGIPDIYAYFTKDGHNYLVMEYIKGPNLAEGLSRQENGRSVQGGPQAPEDVVRYVIQVCDVLSYLGKQKPPVIHNDIKPANIILDQNTGHAVLVDFGTARTRHAPAGVGASGGRPTPGRQQSSIYGTIGYAAPELYEGRAEPKSDVYALAATAYHLLTDDDPRVHPFKFPEMDTIPEPLRSALSDALAVEVSERLSADELRDRLQHTGDTQAKQPPRQPARLALITKRLVHDLDKADPGEIVIANQGGSELRGTATPSHPWVKVAQQFTCPPGQTRRLPLTFDVAAIEPGRLYRAEVKVAAAGQTPVAVPLEVRVPPPLLEITPMQVNLGTVSRRQLMTARATFKVRNIGKSRAVTSIQSYPPWLVLDPTTFTCLPGQTQAVELAARRDLLPAGSGMHETTLYLDVEGGYAREVQVSLRTSQVGRKIGSALMIGVALSALLGAVIWFALSVLPLLLP
jgi:serine/threonine protein kinase